MNMRDILKSKLVEYGKDCPLVERFDFFETGSAFTVDPPVLDTDEDWVVWGDSDIYDQVYQYFLELGFTPAESEEYAVVSLRSGRMNIILTQDEQMFRDWRKATAVCKYLNITSKDQRKMVHRIVCGEQTL